MSTILTVSRVPVGLTALYGKAKKAREHGRESGVHFSDTGSRVQVRGGHAFEGTVLSSTSVQWLQSSSRSAEGVSQARLSDEKQEPGA